MAKQVLEGLFDSKVRVRVLRFLFRNFPGFFTVVAIARHSQSSTREVKRELARLGEIGLVKVKTLKVRSSR